MSQSKINIISLGCSKNLVDTEVLMKQLDASHFQVECDQEQSDARTVIINTCGFIGDAKEESVDTILQCVEAKKRGDIDVLFVMGCLSERYRDQLTNEIPEVDKFFGKFDWKAIVKELDAESKPDFTNFRMVTTPKHYAYLKISEGCNRSCSYCAIPLITGKHKSRSIEDILVEAENLVEGGVKELLVIAQDLSYYGVDLYKESRLAELIERLSQIRGLKWIKLHYAYPTQFPFDILPVMRENPKVCAYLDIALQHSSDNMLKLMRRGIDREKTVALINRIREEVPGITLRTTMLVGHPGETEEDMEDLKKFVREMKFERLGVFAYSNEEDTFAAENYEDDIPQEEKERRRDEIMEIQQEISRELNASRVGQKLNVVIDREEGDYYIGRTEFDSPEVDPEVLIPTEFGGLQIGEFYEAEITDVEDYDLFARIL
ncbi:MAG: 30S ribosomal protein S12 methylthiotransferase RimO [Marinifilaceae bacterium]